MLKINEGTYHHVNSCILSSLTLFIDTFLCCVAYLFFCILLFFIVMLNVAYYVLLSYSRELAHELSTCVYVHHCCAWLALLEKVFQHIKMICNTARPYISIFFFLLTFRESKDPLFCSASHEGISGTMVITDTVVITERHPRLVTAGRHPHFMPASCNGSCPTY